MAAYQELLDRTRESGFTLTPKQWIERTGAVGITSKQGKTGGTYAHSEIVFAFMMWLSPKFRLVMMRVISLRNLLRTGCGPMNDVPQLIVIPASKPDESEGTSASDQHLRVAAYCRVSTGEAEQLTSFKAQKAYYTDKTMTNPEWLMAGIFADEGITGTSTKKRPEFMKIIQRCRKGQIDLVLTKSISCFACNTVASPNGTPVWRTGVLHRMLGNEKYVGDVLMQKTYVKDCLTKKAV